jgi:hypothetical protein
MATGSAMERVAMPKDDWNDLPIDKKFASLRRDIARLFSVYQDLDRRLAAGGQHLGEAVTKSTQALAEVRELKDRLSNSPGSE